MKLPIRFFGIGLLTAAIIFLISIYFFSDREVNLAEVSLDHISDYLESEGYHVITQEQYITLAVKEREEQEKKNEEANEEDEDIKEEETDKKTEEEKKTDTDEDKEKEDKKKEDQKKEEEKEDSGKKEEKKVYKYTLKVEPNMLSNEVSKLLEDNKIIKNAGDFAKYLEDNDYSRFIQLGDHKLTSDMSHYEIAEKITAN